MRDTPAPVSTHIFCRVISLSRTFRTARSREEQAEIKLLFMDYRAMFDIRARARARGRGKTITTGQLDVVASPTPRPGVTGATNSGMEEEANRY